MTASSAIILSKQVIVKANQFANIEVWKTNSETGACFNALML